MYYIYMYIYHCILWTSIFTDRSMQNRAVHHIAVYMQFSILFWSDTLYTAQLSHTLPHSVTLIIHRWVLVQVKLGIDGTGHIQPLSFSLSHTHTRRKKKTGGRGVIYIPKARHSTSTKCTQTMPTFTLVRKDHTITYHLFHVIESRTIFDMISWGFAKGFYHKMYSMWI